MIRRVNMYCPSYIVVLNRFICLTMHSDRDVPKKYVPKAQWVNLFRYELVIYPKAFNISSPMRVLNKGGMAHIAASNFFYRIKVKLGLQKAI